MKGKGKGYVTLLILLLIIAGMSALLYYGVDTKEDKKLFSVQKIQQGLDLKGGVYIVYEADKENPTQDEMTTAESLIRQRLDRMGSTEATVSIQGGNRLRVEIPGTEDADKAVNDIGQTAMLTFVDEEGNVVLTGKDVVDARMHSGQLKQNGPIETFIVLNLSGEGAQKFAEATQNNIGKTISIKLDNDVLSSPTVQNAILNGEATITGGFDAKEAENLASLIRSGALPFKLNVIEMNRIGAQLGAEALDTSIQAGIIGFVLVVIFMIVMYNLSGLAANIALVVFLLLELLILSIFKITLTLPGIAGIVLTVGMAVDANVIIFERFKEEIKRGKTLKASIKAGYKRALPAILDGNITTLIAAIILYWLGSGPIKGFAETLTMGIIVSMFTALFVTRLIMNAFITIGIVNPEFFINRFTNKKKEVRFTRIIENKFKFFALSAVIALIGLSSIPYNYSKGNGAVNVDVDFSGGSALSFNLGEDAVSEDISQIVVKATGQESPKIQKIIGSDEVSIKTHVLDETQRTALVDGLKEKYPDSELLSFSDVSSTVSGEMRSKALLAVGISCIAMLIYISFRFRDARAGTAAIIALIHDAILVFCVYTFFRVPINSSFIAAILTILGYSINATIVIFDRIRENKSLFGSKKPLAELMNESIRQTLMRSINTSLTTFIVITCVYILGVTSVKDFAFPIMVGILAGTYSSIFIASSVWYSFSKSKNDNKNFPRESTN